MKFRRNVLVVLIIALVICVCPTSQAYTFSDLYANGDIAKKNIEYIFNTFLEFIKKQDFFEESNVKRIVQLTGRGLALEQVPTTPNANLIRLFELYHLISYIDSCLHSEYIFMCPKFLGTECNRILFEYCVEFGIVLPSCTRFQSFLASGCKKQDFNLLNDIQTTGSFINSPLKLESSQVLDACTFKTERISRLANDYPKLFSEKIEKLKLQKKCRHLKNTSVLLTENLNSLLQNVGDDNISKSDLVKIIEATKLFIFKLSQVTEVISPETCSYGLDICGFANEIRDFIFELSALDGNKQLKSTLIKFFPFYDHVIYFKQLYLQGCESLDESKRRLIIESFIFNIAICLE